MSPATTPSGWRPANAFVTRSTRWRTSDPPARSSTAARPRPRCAADLDRVVLQPDRERHARRRARAPRRRPRAAPAVEPLRLPPLRLSYPLLECELLRRRQARLVADIDHSQPAATRSSRRLAGGSTSPRRSSSTTRPWASCTATERRAGVRWRSSTPTPSSTSRRGSRSCSSAPSCAAGCATSAARSAGSRRGRRPAPASSATGRSTCRPSAPRSATAAPGPPRC